MVGIVNNYLYISLMLLTISLILYFLVKYNYPKLRGHFGEKWVSQELQKLPNDEYLILNDIMIKHNEKTYQIDHIVISNKGVFVIETKNYHGKIYGNQYNKKWQQWNHNKKREFYNPIRQNYGHIKALEELLDLDAACFISIICFSNQAKLNVKTNDIVINLRNLYNVIYEYETKEFEFDIKELKNKILKNNITDSKIRKKHIKNIKNNNK